MAIRKTTLALVGLDRIKDFDAIGVNQSDPAVAYKRNLMERIYIESADDPSIYIPHSCHDMIAHDGRGRMLRAFPTFYMVFVDEGRKIGAWKLHDNFYSTMNIADIQIVKSRKIASDTATITMSNFYDSYTTTNDPTFDDDSISDDETWDYMVNSIFSPKTVFEDEETARSNLKPEKQIRLRAGARIHIRMGYGANAANLPVVFNGVIAEVSALDTVEIIAQGDGIELMNPIMEDEEAHDYTDKDDWLPGNVENRETPKEIMNAILTTHGGPLAKTFKDGIGENGTFAGLINSNPFGIYHFGDPDYTDILKSGEPTQNIFEATSKPAWGSGEDSVTNKYATDDVPCITFEVLNKTVWDIAHICKSVSPDFICGIAPFGFRSTLFIGAPRFYYAYDYAINGNTIMERRKPYQQYHMYSSSSDIIGNGIAASTRDMKTAAVGLYEVAESGNIKSQKKVGPIYADVDIYPENQRTMVVDTQLYGKGVPYIGFVTNTLTNDLLDGWASPDSTNHEEIAWRMTASALKDKMKDMYCGDLVILGDPTIKPHDRIYLDDSYSGITGQCLAKEVVHSFSVNGGFTTTVSPDLIGVVDDPFEITVQHKFGLIGGLSYMAINMGTYAAYNRLVGLAISTKRIQNLSLPVQKAAQALGGKISGIARLSKNLGSAISSIGSLKNTISVVGNAIKLGRGVAGIGAAAVGGGALALGVLLAGTIGIAIAGKYICYCIERTMRNRQAMQIFPLKRYGIPMTAGVDGSKGFVYGSPSYYKQGGIDKFLNNWLGPLSDNDSFPQTIIKTLLSNDEIMSIASKSQHDLGMTNTDGSYIANEKSFQNTLKGSVTSQGKIPNDYRSMQIAKLATSPEEIKNAYKKYAILDVTRFQNNPALAQNLIISEYDKLKPYIQEQFFQILHEIPALNKGSRVNSQIININGQEKHIKIIYYKTKSGSDIYDVAMLNPVAIEILYELVRRTKLHMLSSNTSDPYENYEYMKTSFLILKSALRIGDYDTSASTGFTFILEARGNAVQPLVDATNEFISELEKDADGNTLYNKVLFECKKLNDSERAYAVKMPSTVNIQDVSKE